jgi:hypothetical protein
MVVIALLPLAGTVDDEEDEEDGAYVEAVADENKDEEAGLG